MATYLFRSIDQSTHNSCGINAIIASAATEGIARQRANELQPWGTRVPEEWIAVKLADDDLPASIIPPGQQPMLLIEGRVLCPGDLSRGGNRYEAPIE